VVGNYGQHNMLYAHYFQKSAPHQPLCHDWHTCAPDNLICYYTDSRKIREWQL